MVDAVVILAVLAQHMIFCRDDILVEGGLGVAGSSVDEDGRELDNLLPE